MALLSNGPASQWVRTGQPQSPFGTCRCSWVHELLLMVYQEICQCHNADIRPSKQSKQFQGNKTGWMGIDSGCWAHCLEVKKSLHQCPHPQGFQTCWADYCAIGCKRHHDRCHSCLVWWFHHSLTSQLLLTKMLWCGTQLWHVQSGALGYGGDYELMASLRRGSKSLGTHTMRPWEPGVLPNIKWTHLAAGYMGRDPLFIQFYYRTPGWQEEPSLRTIQKSWLSDMPWICDTIAPGHLSSDHHYWIIWWPSTAYQGSPGDRLFSHKNTTNLGRDSNPRW